MATKKKKAAAKPIRNFPEIAAHPKGAPHKEFKKAGRKPKNEADKVVSKGVYLTNREWDAVEAVYGSGTAAIRQVVLPGLGGANEPVKTTVAPRGGIPKKEPVIVVRDLTKPTNQVKVLTDPHPKSNYSTKTPAANDFLEGRRKQKGLK